MSIFSIPCFTLCHTKIRILFDYSAFHIYAESTRQFSAATSRTPSVSAQFVYFSSVRSNMSRESSEDPDTSFKTTLVASLTVYNSSNSGKSKSKAAEKTSKVKEIDFTVTEHNYLEILTEILKSHSQEKFKVTAKRHFSFKYIYPPSKVYVIPSHQSDRQLTFTLQCP